MGAKAVSLRCLGVILFVIVCACLLFLSAPPSVLADGGMISIADKLLYEPGQKAIIAWDGQQEILILSTDVYAEGDTIALRIIPLPSQPEKIEQGDFNSFLRIGDLIYDRFRPRQGWFECVRHQGEGGAGVDIVFHEKIGAHDIWVAKAPDAAGFIDWAEDFLIQNQIQYQISSPQLESLAAQYIQQGIQFFVFDLIELTPDQNSVEPIVYQFQSDTLYFPLKISSIIPGETTISLFLLTPQPLVDASQLPENKSDQGGMEMKIAATKDKRVQFKLGEKELASIDPRLTELLPGHAWLTVVQSYDPRDYRLDIPLASLDKDVKLTLASVSYD
ncbi:MAG: DUF2330 domain-containing protein [Chloroflexi bacterium]|nr:DUF2330 domain-containing protein [Chloroflexota bacterium]